MPDTNLGINRMALIYCRECGAKISDKAVKCPKCGSEQNVQVTKTFSNGDVGVVQKKSNKSNTNKPNNAIKWSIVCIVVLLVAIIGYLFYSNLGTGTINGHGYVDLGLPSGTKWATCNVGASEPEEYGNYYAWGETTSYTKDNSHRTYGKSMGDISGDASYDVAQAKWGGTWRLPTAGEMKELVNKCTWTWTTQSGVNGYKVIGPNGNSIFLPAAGYYDHHSSRSGVGGCGDYWSSTIPSEGDDYETIHETEISVVEVPVELSSTTPSESDDYSAYHLHIYDSDHDVCRELRFLGCSVRPVSE